MNDVERERLVCAIDELRGAFQNAVRLAQVSMHILVF